MRATFDMRRAADAILLHARVYPRIAFEIDSIDAAPSCVMQAGIPASLPAIVLRGRDMPGLAAVLLAGPTRRMDFGSPRPAADGVEPASLIVAAALKASLDIPMKQKPAPKGVRRSRR